MVRKMDKIRAAVAASAVLILVSPTAAAQEPAERTVPVIVDRATCLRLVEAPRDLADGGAEYQSGVDAYGRPVVPAEGPDGPPHDWLPDPVEIDLSVPLAAKLGIGDNATNYEADARLGTLTIRNDRVYLNGREVASGDLPELREACRRLNALQDAAEDRKPRR